MTAETIALIVTSVSTVVGPCVSWFAARKKYNVEVEDTKIDSLRKIIDEQKREIQSLREGQNLYMERNLELEKQVVDLRKQMYNLMQTICLDLTCTHRKLNEENCSTRYTD